MRRYDLSPLFRSTVGFDRLDDLFDKALDLEQVTPSYPPYNIEKVGAESYRITMAVAGFREGDLDLTFKPNALTVRGKIENVDEPGKALYRGIAARAFERRFQLADHVRVTGASLDHGLLRIELAVELPEAMKPRQIAITTAAAREPESVEAKAA